MSTTTMRRNPRSVAERLWGRVVVVDNGCWEFQGKRTRFGYGRLFCRVRWDQPARSRYYILSHRLSWELANTTEIPEGLEVLHSCDNAPCVNPAHLRLGTQKDNAWDTVSRGRHASAKQTHCAQGHEFTPENTAYTVGRRNGRRQRACRECARIRNRVRRARAA